MKLLVLLLSCLALGALGFMVDRNNPNNFTICGTMEALHLSGQGAIMDRRRAPNSACVEYATCDDRDKLLAAGYGGSFPDLQVKLKYFVARLNGNPVVTVENLQSNVDDLNAEWRGTGIVWDNDGDVSNDITYVDVTSCTPGYNSFGTWYTAVINFKNSIGVSNRDSLNVYVHCMGSSTQGTLLGVATFPWDKSSLTNTGGLFMNTVAIPGSTLSHEIGHNLGLWHTFHGVDEVSCSSACAESQSDYGTVNGDEVGDMCSDSIAAPLYYPCGDDSSKRDCEGKTFNSQGATIKSYENIMSYAPDECTTKFTPKQGQRATCFACEILKSQLYNPEDCP